MNLPYKGDYLHWQKEELFSQLKTCEQGLSEAEVLTRHKLYGQNIIASKKISAPKLFFRQFKDNPLILILAAATFVSFLLGQQISSYYIFSMILLSVVLGFWNEYFAQKTIETLLKKISLEAVVIRNGEKKDIPVAHLTIGDIVLLAPGSVVPADLRLIEANSLEIDQAALTGESKTVPKTDQTLSSVPSDINQMKNIAFMGTTIRSGWGKGVVVAVGKITEFGKISQSVSYIKPETSFQNGLTKFGNFLIKVILILTAVIFGVNALLGHHLLESVLFSLAIAVGLTPELLPVIVTVSLAHGAGKLAKKEVLVKQLIAIENLGNMDVLCTDKTGTLTEGKIRLIDYIDRSGKRDNQILTYSLLCNSAVIHHKIIGNTIDSAIWEYALKNNISPDKEIEKIYEEPFDYSKRLMFTVISQKKRKTMIIKGAPEEVLNLCEDSHKKTLLDVFQALGQGGYHVIALAQKKASKKDSYNWKDLEKLEFLGFVTFLDIPKKTTKEALTTLQNLNVAVKVITGDGELVTRKICNEVGMEVANLMLGSQIDNLSDSQLAALVNNTNVFARVSPEQKLRIIQALQQNGHTVGYMGDGINDVPSLHGADVGISVSSAVDVAKSTASVVLMRKSLEVIAEGIMEGRRIFNNTIKYILMGTSSNFGNMFSAAGASFFLPFLPMTAAQILLTNGLYDISQLTIPSDNVDPESLVKPRHWNINFIKHYMVFFGPISSLYDFLTFGVMIFLFHAKGAFFQTGWFIESLATEILVVFVIRTGRTPFFKSRPGNWLALTCLGIVLAGIALPFTPFSSSLGFIPPPPLYFLVLIILVSTYLILVETSKKLFLKKYTM